MTLRIQLLGYQFFFNFQLNNRGVGVVVPTRIQADITVCYADADANILFCGEPAISLHSHHVSLVQWTTRLIPVTRDLGSNPQGGTYVKTGFSC